MSFYTSKITRFLLKLIFVYAIYQTPRQNIGGQISKVNLDPIIHEINMCVIQDKIGIYRQYLPIRIKIDNVDMCYFFS